jgi:hypothetical protein
MFLMCIGQSPVPAVGWLTITPLDSRTGLRLAGEADLRTVPALRHAVAGLPADAREVHLQAVGLEFVDVPAARSRRLASWWSASSGSLRPAARGGSVPGWRDWTSGGQT